MIAPSFKWLLIYTLILQDFLTVQGTGLIWLGIELLSSRWSVEMPQNVTIQYLQEFETVGLLWRKYFAHFSEDLQKLAFPEKNQSLLQSKNLSPRIHVCLLLVTIQLVPSYLKALLPGPWLPILPYQNSVQRAFTGQKLGFNSFTSSLSCCTIGPQDSLWADCVKDFNFTDGHKLVSTHIQYPFAGQLLLCFVRDLSEFLHSNE